MASGGLLKRQFDSSSAGRKRFWTGALAFVCCAGLASVTVVAQPRISGGEPIRIASWNLLDAVGVGIIDRAEPAARTWRNTFGSERRVVAKPKFAGDRLGADVVLLQGVKSVGEVRQLFPARTWKLIVSRQILRDGTSGRFSASTRIDGAGTTTAIAVRYQRRVRVTGIEHLLDLAPVASDDASSSALQKPAAGAQPENVEKASSGPEPSPSAGVAVRLSQSGRVFWVVSAALGRDCSLSGEKPCEAAGRLEAWLNEKRDKGRGIVVGGQLYPGLRQAGPRGACADQEIIADKALDAETGADTVAGCIAFADVSPL